MAGLKKALRTSETRTALWFLRHRRKFLRPAQLVGLVWLVPLAAVAIPYEVLGWLGGQLDRVTRWINAVLFWARIDDSDPVLERLRTHFERKLEVSKQPK